MKKSIKELGLEALNWEIVRVERTLFAYNVIKESVQQAMNAMREEDMEASMAIMRAILKMENDQQQRIMRLQLEQVCKERAIEMLPLSMAQSESMSVGSFDTV
ncbi:hypothetical protein [Cohnella rhizosphaerae]|uniref:Uncharacterized protein n=1 Tax=Cohnella rhizosphaerae TaxID=1457232 RepID=A0A9X4L0A8_9BACL|nr:hypothetical protein [Cohnella rhizosphaerae]MDG0814217.1 hypothetical protein [Cohnella rhizosphaerae]